MPPFVDSLRNAFLALDSVRNTAPDSHLTTTLSQFVSPLTRILLPPANAAAPMLEAGIQAFGEASELDLIVVLRVTEGGTLDTETVWSSGYLQSPGDPLTGTWIGAVAPLTCQSLSGVGHFADLSEMESGCRLKDRLQSLNIRSALTVPLPGVEGFSGLVVFATSRRRKVFSAQEILIFQVISSMVGSLLLRRDSEHEVHQVQEELRRERNKLKATLAALPDLLVELDANGRMTSFYSHAMAALVERPEQYIGATPEQALPERVAKAIRKVMQDVDERGFSDETRFTLRLEDGRHWFNVSAYRQAQNTNSDPHSYLLIIRDITTERLRTEEIERLSNIVRLTSNLVVVTDASRRIEWVNTAFEQRTGYTLSEARGKTPGSLLQGPESDSGTIDQIREALSRGKGIKVEILNYDKAGQTYWVEMEIQPTHDEEGLLSGYVAVQSDISERRKQVASLKKAEERARADQAASMDAWRDGIAITDELGQFTYMNRAHQEMFAIPRLEDIIGRPWSDLYDPDKAALINQFAFPKLLETGEWKGEIAGRRFDGSTIEQEVSLSLKEDGGIVCITRDIGERLRAQFERSRLREELQIAQRQEIIGQMAAGLAHDFNNLIASISGSAALILSSEDQGNASHAERIKLAATKANELVRRMVDIGARTPERQRIDLRAALHEIADLVQSGISSDIHLAIPEEIPDLFLDADPTDFLQVVLNLAFNSRDALQASRSEKAEISISMCQVHGGKIDAKPSIGRISSTAEYICVDVRDNGPGMDAETLRQAFRPYFTTKGSRGSGLGLSVVSSIVEAYDGAILIETASNAGCKIRVLWPTAPPAPNPVQPDLPKIRTTGRLDGKSILLVDDSEELLRVLSIFLERAGAEVCVSTDPLEALESIRSAPDNWDLLITDFDMPEMNGADLAKEAKLADATLPIVLITALPDWRGRARRSSGRDFLAVLGKPVDAAELVTTAEVAMKFVKT